MKIKNYRSSTAIALLSVAFTFVFLLSAAPEASAQRYLTEIRSGSEARGIGQFANDLNEFLQLAKTIENDSSVSPIQLGRLERAGKKVKSGANGLRGNLKSLITKLKNQNQWDDQLDTEINGVFGNRRVKGFFRKNGGRKILLASDSAINSISRDVDAVINDAKSSGNAINFNGVTFTKASFAPTAPAAGKGRFKCVLLGIAIFGAELIKADRTAENLDGFFDKGCGANAGVDSVPTT